MRREEIDLTGALDAAEEHFHNTYGLWGLRALSVPPAILFGLFTFGLHPLLGILVAASIYFTLYGGLKKITYTRIK